MSNVILSFGSAPVSYSITNSSAAKDNTLDNFQPFSFFEYLKYSNQTATPEQFTKGYNDYLQSWYSITNAAEEETVDQIKQRYIDLLRDIALNYTSTEEKRFLSNIDYSSASDLAIAIPFYARKLREICLLYAKKREAIKTRIYQVKSKGTAASLEKIIFQNIIDYLYVTTEEGINSIDIENVAQTMQIDVCEFFDTYSDYFDLDPSTDARSQLLIENDIRAEYYTSNVNAISAQLFLGLDASILDSILSTPFYLKEIGQELIINPQSFIEQTLLNLDCNVQEFANLLELQTDSLSANYALKKKLIEKYIGTDFYYVSTNASSVPVSGVLFRASNPCGNILNKRFATTATTPEDELKTAKQLGLFFRPDRLGVLQFTAPEKDYYINHDALEANKIYIFPDPEIYGDVTNFHYSNLSYPLLYIVDYSTGVKKLDAGAAYGYIKSNEYIQSFYAYFSEPVYINTENVNVSSYDANFQSVFDQGIFTQIRQDIYGNEYGLLKDIQRYRKNITNTNSIDSKCITLDGHTFNDVLEGYNFDYSTQDDEYFGSVRTGLTAVTVNSAPPSGSSFALSGANYTIYFREFSPYFTCPSAELTYTCSTRDGGAFTAPDNTLLPDVSSDSPLWSSSSTVYYKELCDAALSATNVLVPAMLFGALTATVIAPELSSSRYEVFDANYFNNDCVEVGDYNYSNSLSNYIDLVNDGCTTVLEVSSSTDSETLDQMEKMIGSIIIKNKSSNTIQPLSATLSATFTKYNESILDEIYGINIIDFDLVYDTIAIKANNYIVFDKIVMNESGYFIKPQTNNSSLIYNSNNYNCASNFFFVEKQNRIWVFTTNLKDDALSATNGKVVYPSIYSYDILKNRLKREFPLDADVPTLSSLFTNPLSAVNIIYVDDAHLSYAQENDKFAMSWVGYDMNNMSYIFHTWFDYKNSVITIDESQTAVFAPDNIGTTYNFTTGLAGFTTIAVTSTTNAQITTSGNALFFN